MVLPCEHTQRTYRCQDQRPLHQPEQNAKESFYESNETTTSVTAVAVLAAGNVARVAFGVTAKGPAFLLGFDAKLFREVTHPFLPELLRGSIAVNNVARRDRHDIVVVRDVSGQCGEA